MKNKIKRIIFDWDGTLSDSADGIVSAMQQAIADLKLPTREDNDIRQLIGLGLEDGMRRLFPGLNADSVIKMLMAYRTNFLAHPQREAGLFRGAREALVSLSQEFKLAIATGKSRQGLDRALEHHSDIAGLMCATKTADETANKPDPKMLEELLWEFGLSADEALMVGDTEYDMAMAKALRMPAIGVACGVHDSIRLEREGALTVLPDVAGLPEWMDSNTRYAA